MVGSDNTRIRCCHRGFVLQIIRVILLIRNIKESYIDKHQHTRSEYWMNMSNLLLNRSGTRHKAEAISKTEFTFNNVKSLLIKIYYPFQQSQIDDFI